MSHLVINPIRRSECPQNVRWFVEGYMGIKFLVNADGIIYPDYGLGGKPGWRTQTKIISAENIAKHLNILAEDLGLCGLIDYWLGVDYIRWAADSPSDFIDNQPDDYINPSLHLPGCAIEHGYNACTCSGIMLSEERETM